MKTKLRKPIIALPKGRMVLEARWVFAKNGYTSLDLDRELFRIECLKRDFNEVGINGKRVVTIDEKLNDNYYEGERADFIIPKSSDLPAYVDEGIADIGIVGKDSKDEYALEGQGRGRGYISAPVSDGFEFPKMRFAIIGRKGKEEYQRVCEMMQENKDIIVATSYPKQAKAFLLRNYPDYRGEFIDMMTLDGEVELAVRVGRANIGFELVSSGKSVIRNGLCSYIPEEKAEPIPVLQIINRGARNNNQELAELFEKIEKGGE